MHDIATRARAWALWLTQQRTVTGSHGERDLPARWRDKLGAEPTTAPFEVFLLPTGENDRSCLCVLARGAGPETVLLTGHFDTVTVEDYGDLAPLATDPEVLLPALQRRLAHATAEAERRAQHDFASGDFLPGRGLLDMKAGLAAGLAALEAFASARAPRGNVLFVAVPDEEVNSAGARALAASLPVVSAHHNLDIVAAINLDCIGDIGDGSAGRSVALGSVGKVLLTAHVVGTPAHASHPYQGINAAALAGALAARFEWAAELADTTPDAQGIPPTLLSMKDNKQRYDVTMPDSTFVTWNVLTHGRSAEDNLCAAESLARAVVGDVRQQFAARRNAVTGRNDALPDIAVLRTDAVMASLSADAKAALLRLGTALANQGLSLPDQNARLSDAMWRASGRLGPAIVLGFGSVPYPPVSLSASPRAMALRAAIDSVCTRFPGIGTTAFFPGISDMSFLGEADTNSVALIAAQTPNWSTGVTWSGAVAGIPTVNIGPWGRDYHTPLERVHMPYAFDVLPRLLLDVTTTVLNGAPVGRGRG